MSLPNLRPLAARKSHRALVDLLERRSRGDQWLFEARGAAHQLAFEVAKEGFAALESVCLAIRDLFGHLLRNGVQEGDEVLPAVGRLLRFVGESLDGRVASEAQPKRGDLQIAPAGKRVLLSNTSSALPPLPTPEPPAGDLRLHSAATAASTNDAPSLGGAEAWRLVNETRLGEILVRDGRIDGKTLDQALVLQQVGCKRLGEVLVGMGKLEPEVLAAALDNQRELTLKLADGITLQGGLRLGPTTPSFPTHR
jgi:hypothetical protein